MTEIDLQQPDWARTAINLAQPRLGARILSSTDDFFASHDRLLDPTPPVFKPGVYDDNGKWMDGWESRRKRGEGHDHCVLALGQPAHVRGIGIDTSHFTGNYARAASLEACALSPDQAIDDARWTEILAAQPLAGDRQQFFELPDGGSAWTHFRLNAFPDGGIARLRLYGRFANEGLTATGLVDLAAVEHGGRAIAASDAHFGALSNILMPGRGADMGDGWETRRRREPGFDWGIIRLGRRGTIKRLTIDTAHFKGNFAWKVAVYGGCVGPLPDLTLPALSIYWPELLPPTKLTADAVRDFEDELTALGPIDHLRVDMIPDGGLSRLRAWGIPETGGDNG